MLKTVAAWVMCHNYLPSWTLRREKVLKYDDSLGLSRDNIYLECTAKVVMAKVPKMKHLDYVRMTEKNHWMKFVGRPFNE